MRYPRLALLGIIVASALRLPAAEAPADLVIVNGKVLTVDAKFSRASAVAIRDGKFVAVGNDADIRKLVGPKTTTIDAKQQSVVPGLIESHVHATGAARIEGNVPFRQLHSIGEIQDWVRERARELGPGAWIQLPRVDVTRIKERRIPNRADLDAAAPNNPAVFTWQYGSKTVQRLNSKAIAAAGITKDTQPPPRGKIYLDDKGEPTGVLDDASVLLTRFMPARDLPPEKYEDLLVTLLKRYNEIGITSITERGSNPEGYRTYQKLRDEGRLPVRTTVTIRLVTDGSVEATENFIKKLPYKTGDGDDWVRVGPLKVSVDGGALYGTAYMREPYGPQAFSLYGISDPQYRGRLEIPPEKLKNIFRTVLRMGWQMSTHVTGDAGVDHALDALEAANADAPVAPRRYNLIHGYFPNVETAQRAARLGAVIDTQPMWFYKDGDALLDALGEKRMKSFIGLRTWRDAGLKVALNADHMQGFDPNTSLNPYNPFLAMQTAITRKTEGGKVIGPQHKISREQALKGFTTDAAWMSFDETKKGTIEVGKFGDLAILTGDFLGIAEDKIHTLRAHTTIVGGKVVYQR